MNKLVLYISYAAVATEKKHYEESVWDGNSCELRKGVTLNSRKDARKFIKMYEEKNLCKMSIADGGAVIKVKVER